MWRARKRRKGEGLLESRPLQIQQARSSKARAYVATNTNATPTNNNTAPCNRRSATHKPHLSARARAEAKAKEQRRPLFFHRDRAPRPLEPPRARANAGARPRPTGSTPAPALVPGLDPSSLSRAAAAAAVVSPSPPPAPPPPLSFRARNPPQKNPRVFPWAGPQNLKPAGPGSYILSPRGDTRIPARSNAYSGPACFPCGKPEEEHAHAKRKKNKNKIKTAALPSPRALFSSFQEEEKTWHRGAIMTAQNDYRLWPGARAAALDLFPPPRGAFGLGATFFFSISFPLAFFV